ncbi:S66 peptidase family protein [Asaccharospora irregularis]|uniref:Muramoyltetrapeptide carboxypeptidase n=1 Tax=Asaccharospora irregularis DSM 2635 TaxID=1121321 RepID=A0A1M5NQW2_9FIRM|nr:LD-carboxypeptidase [Asaccharospora irregularis]SHG91559.1 muramoyltetrapeptide carboxypeptidase [Asaccharospora irregularis DSM 2635]
MKTIKKLKVGDTIGIIAPAGPLKVGNLEEIKSCIESYGYNVKMGKSCYLKYRGYLAGEDEYRAKDIENMFLDKEVDIIMCLRGGYGTTRILDIINYKVIKENPKVFIGFSDITGLHLAFNQKCNLVTYHGIMAASSPRWDEFTYKSLLDVLSFEERLSIENPKDEELYTLREGSASGILVGGNLSLIVSTLGTEYEIDTKDKIFFIEEIGEYIYRVDRMLTQLDLAGKFDECSGIIFGDFKDCRKSNENECELIELLEEVAIRSNKPTLFNLQSGHCMPMISIPIGEECILDASEKKIEFIRKNRIYKKK